MSERRPPTIRDVAARAGVHPATVSRAINRPDVVAPDTLATVLDAVEHLGFVPNRSARHLVSGRADAVGVIVPDITNPYFATIVRAIQQRARDEELATLIADTAGNRAEQRRAVEALSRRVDGIIAITPLGEPADAPVPIVSVNRRSKDHPSVVVDQAAILTCAVEHLTALGHRCIAVLRGPSTYWSARRRDQATEAHRRRNAEASEPVELVGLGPHPATFAGGAAALAEVTACAATAVVAFNDLQAAGLLTAAVAAGVSVPGDLSVIGSDGLDLAEMTFPALSTVAAPLGDLGRAALDRLVAQLRGIDGPAVTTLSPELITRASTARPATDPSTKDHE